MSDEGALISPISDPDSQRGRSEDGTPDGFVNLPGGIGHLTRAVIASAFLSCVNKPTFLRKSIENSCRANSQRRSTTEPKRAAAWEMEILKLLAAMDHDKILETRPENNAGSLCFATTVPIDLMGTSLEKEVQRMHDRTDQQGPNIITRSNVQIRSTSFQYLINYDPSIPMPPG
jgi:hypothetical protein